jgi:transcriptional regulator with XRE-family HTH domain
MHRVNQRDVQEKMARLRARIHSAMLEKELSFSQLANAAGLDSAQTLTDYVHQKEDLPVWVLLKIAEATDKPVWWFLDAQPQGITLEVAQVALNNLAKIRLYVEAIEGEFRSVAGKRALTEQDQSQPVRAPGGERGQVVDLTPYLSRARAILEREVSQEDSGEDTPMMVPVSQESVEMVAHGLFSAEQELKSGVFRAVSSESIEKVSYLHRRGVFVSEED